MSYVLHVQQNFDLLIDKPYKTLHWNIIDENAHVLGYLWKKLCTVEQKQHLAPWNNKKIPRSETTMKQYANHPHLHALFIRHCCSFRQHGMSCTWLNQKLTTIENVLTSSVGSGILCICTAGGCSKLDLAEEWSNLSPDHNIMRNFGFSLVSPTLWSNNTQQF